MRAVGEKKSDSRRGAVMANDPSALRVNISRLDVIDRSTKMKARQRARPSPGPAVGETHFAAPFYQDGAAVTKLELE